MSAQAIKIPELQDNKMSFAEAVGKLARYKVESLSKEAFCSSLLTNQRQKMNGIDLFSKIGNDMAKAVFFDHQYRGILDKQKYGNEGKSRDKRRCNLEQMSEELIEEFIGEIDRVLKPSAYLFLWVDKFHLCEGVSHWFKNTSLQTVDMMVWEKHKIGMGYRTRNKCEFLLILQKTPVVRIQEFLTTKNLEI